MKYQIDVSVRMEGKTVVRVRAEAKDYRGTVVALGEGKAQSVAKAVGVALEGVWDSLVPIAIVEARQALAGDREGVLELPGLLPDVSPRGMTIPPTLGALFAPVEPGGER